MLEGFVSNWIANAEVFLCVCFFSLSCFVVFFLLLFLEMEGRRSHPSASDRISDCNWLASHPCDNSRCQGSVALRHGDCVDGRFRGVSGKLLDGVGYGDGSKPTVLFCLVGEFTTHFRTYFSGWIGSRSMGVRAFGFDPWPYCLRTKCVIGQLRTQMVRLCSV